MLQNGTGPGGWRRDAAVVKRVMVPSGRAEPGGANEFFLNQLACDGGSLRLREKDTAAYLHVDDGLFFSHRSSVPACDEVMHRVAAKLEQVGFVVPQQTESAVTDKKLVGYVLDPNEPRLRLPPEKARDLQSALRWAARVEMVDTAILHSLIGIWIWACLLKRPLLATLGAVFVFLERYPRMRVKWWPTARREVLMAADLVPALEADLGRPTLDWIFASDAEGINSTDLGGFGIVAARASLELADEAALGAPRAGRTIAGLDGTFGAMRRHQRELEARVASSRVPPEVFKLQWVPILGRRWRRPQIILLLEGQATIVLLEMLAASPACRKHVVVSLQDNEAWSSAAAKGRSPNWWVNRLLRRRGALCTAAEIDLELPWTDTLRQPADALSRTRS